MTQTTPEIGKSIHAGGVMTNYHEAGSGTPVILIHGSGPGVSAWANWRLAIPFFSERLHVFAYDQVGFGYSELPAQHAYGLGRWTEHLLSFMQAVGIKRAHLVGNSMGAAVALAAAVTHPEVVDRLVLMGPMGVRFPIVEGLDAVWGYTPSISNMKRLLAIFTYDHDRFVTDELAELRYRASTRRGMQDSFSSMFPRPRQSGVDALAAYEDRLHEVRADPARLRGRSPARPHAAGLAAPTRQNRRGFARARRRAPHGLSPRPGPRGCRAISSISAHPRV